MAELWQAPEEIRTLVREIRDAHHTHLAAASLWVLCSDAAGVRRHAGSGDRLVATQSKKCTTAEKLSTGHDFKIIVRTDTWTKLTDEQGRLAIDEALCRCGVQRVPETIEINGRREVLRDDLGRTIYTDEIAVDRLGNPRWTINPPDASLYFALLARHGEYSDAANNVQRVLAGKPVIQPVKSEYVDEI